MHIGTEEHIRLSLFGDHKHQSTGIGVSFFPYLYCTWYVFMNFFLCILMQFYKIYIKERKLLMICLSAKSTKCQSSAYHMTADVQRR